ncbi:hypothetical protein BSKO_10989 [Bryopsis sp. KO-2023]|nr:hypothetical protein BSKO_10989 [Bryopsis sp. KO-2023]
MVVAQDPAAAVARLQAAGNDVSALKEAVVNAMFLMESPGDNRQKLRAAKTKLRNLLEDSSRGVSVAAGHLPSPHVKDSYDPSQFDILAGKYEKLSWRMISKPGGAIVKPEDFYRLYGLVMQAKEGDNVGERPMWAEKGGLDFEGRARWDAWEAVKGMKEGEAKLQFVTTYHEFSPSHLYKDTR